MTIQQLETFSNTKPELRYITEEIIKYLQANQNIAEDYLVYTALLYQSGTNAPVATILKNTFPGEPFWEYGDVGQYYVSLNGAFTNNKTFAIIQGPHSTPQNVHTILHQEDNTYIRVDTYNQNIHSNSCFYLTPIEIRVYP